MSCLDKAGLERLWQHILIKLGNKADKAVINGGITTPEIGMNITELYFIGSEVLNENIQCDVTLAEGSALHQILGSTYTTLSVTFSGPDINTIYPSIIIGELSFDITSHTPIIGLTNPYWYNVNHDISGSLADMGVTSMTLSQLPDNASDYIQVKYSGILKQANDYADSLANNYASKNHEHTGLDTRIKTIENDYLKTADKQSLQNQINTIMNNPDTEGIINSIYEYTKYIEDHGAIAEGFRTDINKNKQDIATNTQAIAQKTQVQIITWEDDD